MPAQQQEKQADRGQPVRQQLHAIIGEQVLHILGQPADLHRVQVRELWEANYRVNVYVGADAGSAKVAHSFFLLTDGEGNIIASTPQITRQY